MALLWKMTCNLGDPMSLRNPVQIVPRKQIAHLRFLPRKQTEKLYPANKLHICTDVQDFRICAGEKKPMDGAVASVAMEWLRSVGSIKL